MKSIAFDTVVQEGHIEIPAGVAAEIPSNEQLRVVVMWPSSTEEDGWREAGRRQFESAYAPEDDVYEQLTDDPR